MVFNFGSFIIDTIGYIGECSVSRISADDLIKKKSQRIRTELTSIFYKSLADRKIPTRLTQRTITQISLTHILHGNHIKNNRYNPFRWLHKNNTFGNIGTQKPLTPTLDQTSVFAWFILTTVYWLVIGLQHRPSQRSGTIQDCGPFSELVFVDIRHRCWSPN